MDDVVGLVVGAAVVGLGAAVDDVVDAVELELELDPQAAIETAKARSTESPARRERMGEG